MFARILVKVQADQESNLQDDIVSFRFVSVPVISVHFVSGSYRFLAFAFRFVSFPKSGFFPVPFLFVSVVFRFFSVPAFSVSFRFGSCVFRFVSLRFLRFVSFPMSSCKPAQGMLSRGLRDFAVSSTVRAAFYARQDGW